MVAAPCYTGNSSYFQLLTAANIYAYTLYVLAGMAAAASQTSTVLVVSV